MIRVICKLLLIISQVQSIRDKIISYNGIGILLNGLMSFFNKDEGDGIEEILIGILENIVVKGFNEKNEGKMEIENEFISEDESLEHLDMCFKKLDSLNEHKNKTEKSISILHKIMPQLANDYLSTNKALLDRYINYVDFSLKNTGFYFKKYNF